MTYLYKSVKYRPDNWKILKRLAAALSKERGGIKVSIADATIEAAQKMLDERDSNKSTAATPGGQAQD